MTQAKPPLQEARWNLISIVAPLVGIALGKLLSTEHEMSGGLSGPAGLVIIGAGFGSIAGLAAAAIAMARSEPWPWCTALGFLINLPLAGLLLALW